MKGHREALALAWCGLLAAGCTFDVKYVDDPLVSDAGPEQDDDVPAPVGARTRIENCYAPGDEDGDGNADCDDPTCKLAEVCCDAEECCTAQTEPMLFDASNVDGTYFSELTPSEVMVSQHCVEATLGMRAEFYVTRRDFAEGSLTVGISSVGQLGSGHQSPEEDGEDSSEIDSDSLIAKATFRADGSVTFGGTTIRDQLRANFGAHVRWDLVPVAGNGRTMFEPRLAIDDHPEITQGERVVLQSGGDCRSAGYLKFLGDMSGMRVDRINLFQGTCSRPDGFLSTKKLESSTLSTEAWAAGGIGEPALVRVREGAEAGWDLFFTASELPPSRYQTVEHSLGGARNPNPALSALPSEAGWQARGSRLRNCDSDGLCNPATGTFVEPTAARTQEGEWLAAAAFDPDGDGNYEIRMGRVVADEFGYSIYDAYTPELDRSCASLRDPELVRFRDGTSTVDQFVLYYTCKPKTEDAQSRTEVRGVLLDERGHIASDPAPAMTAELAGAFAEGGIEKPVVVPDNPERPTEFRMWFVGKQGVERAIGVAHSATPMGSFAPYSGNPILKKGALPCAGCTIRSLTTSGADAQTGNLHLVVSTEPPPDRDGSTEFWFLEQSWMQPWRLDP